jgi:glycerol-3-phosphate dehydrogenase
MSTFETEVLIIGGGVTGAGIMRDLSLRGIHCILIEKRDLCAGASGGNHGLLHSGSRYVSNDLQSAIECRIESRILKDIAPHCIEETGGLFVGVAGDDEEFAHHFPQYCRKADINCSEISVGDAHAMEPCLSKKLVKAYHVPDATIDPFHLALENVAHADICNGSKYMPHCEIVNFTQANGSLTQALCHDCRSGENFIIKARQFINAGGGWAMNIAAMAGCHDVHLLWSKGTLLVSHDRMTDRVINRLRPPADGDILVPGGTVSILGTTSLRSESIENIRPTVDEVNTNVREGMAMIPALATTRFIRAFSRVRPLVQSAKQSSDRDVARSFSLFEHEESLDNFCTITGGKLTTYRMMAEKTADLVAKRLGNNEPCITHMVSLPDSGGCKWTEPGASPRYWYNAKSPDDMILCECEMVPQSAITEVLASSPGAEEGMSLESIALRTRAGKGPCQGSFCGIRIASHLYDQQYYKDEKGLHHMRDFFNERFKGMRTIIWGQQMAQMELAEALHCGLLGLDNLKSKTDGTVE